MDPSAYNDSIQNASVIDSPRNETTWTLPMSSRIVIMVVFSLILAVGITGNILVLLLMILVKSMQTTVNLCLAVLAVADLGVLTMLPILSVVALFKMDAWFIGKNFCVFLIFYDRGALVCSVLIFVFISVDRYVALCHPFMALRQWTGWRMAALLGAIWVIAALVSVPYTFISRFEKGPNETKVYCYLDFDGSWLRTYETVLSSLVFLLPVPVMCYLYGRMIHSLRTIPLSEPKGVGALAVRRSRSQLIKMLMAVVAIFVTCNVPFRVYILLYFYGYDTLYGEFGLPAENRTALNWTARLLTYVNNAANPIIYFSISSNFRDAFREVFCRRSLPMMHRSHSHSRHTDSTTF